MAVDVVADAICRSTEHRGGPGARYPGKKLIRQLGQRALFVRDGVPDKEVTRRQHQEVVPPGQTAEEDATVAGVDRAPIAAHGVGEWDGGGRNEGGYRMAGAEDAQHRGRAVELAEPAAEGGVRDEAAPALADEGGANEKLRFFGREADDDPVDEIVHQHRQRHPAPLGLIGPRRRRGFGDFGRLATASR